MHHVSVVVGVNDGVMGVFHSDLLVTLLRSGTCWPARPGSWKTPALPERGWRGSVLPLGLLPGTAPGSCLADMIWSVIGHGAGLGRAAVADGEGEPARMAAAPWTLSAASS